MDFNPYDPIIQLCIQGMQLEDTGDLKAAGKVYKQVWNDATNDFEKFLGAWFVARVETGIEDRLKWYGTALQLAAAIDNDAVKAALPLLYTKMAECYESLGNTDEANKHRKLASASIIEPSDKGPFYHGTRANLKIGDFLIAGRLSNYHAELVMNHVYFTAVVNGAGLAAALANGNGDQRVYIVEPSGSFEDDPNVTNKKFPGNPTRSYRTTQPLKITGELTNWQQLTPEQIKHWREKLANSKGEIIN
ncbi:NAD(+)--rifampin ADP-ribosyltransferase [Mucilaginibacter sp. 21P]|nr:NAD(+)--rifampin ADP-ribosyltransferase [Mucilaginibacter sp. 21P]QXV64238.1 NAD(+)--rifampin ADP-ribosyltransferase [Mucilaginibacter sp. 21P]